LTRKRRIICNRENISIIGLDNYNIKKEEGANLMVSPNNLPSYGGVENVTAFI
jgi:hypothetical protein